MHDFINFIVNFAEELGYTGIFLMMVLESSFIPFPSELAMIPAWFLASIWKMDFVLAFIAWTAWAIIWATINYVLAFHLWSKVLHKIIKKYWKYVFLKEKHYTKSEKYFTNHWAITVFLARFIPAVRQLISLPAGAFEMNYAKFFFYTWIWAWLWNLVLMTIWYIAWENKELIKENLNTAMIWWILFILLIWGLYYLINKKKNAKQV